MVLIVPGVAYLLFLRFQVSSFTKSHCYDFITSDGKGTGSC